MTKKKTIDNIGNYQKQKIPFFRRMIRQSLEAIPAGHNMMALVEIDVTEARSKIRELRKKGVKVSLFSFLVKSIATLLNENRPLNSIISKRKIIHFDDVDINMPIELEDNDGKFPRQIVIRKAHLKSASEIYREIEESRNIHQKQGNAGKDDKWAIRFMRIMAIFPNFFRNWIIRTLSNQPLNVKKMSGTTFVTSVGMFGKLNGYVIPYMGTPRAVSFAIGSLIRKPVIIKKQITEREFISMTIVYNHDIIDGAPAARYTNRLRKIIESAEIG